MKIKINFVDFWVGFDKTDNYFINILRKMYGADSIVIEEQPDYLFYSCFGYDNLKYDCIKIYFVAENLVPDFNLCDYALGCHEIIFDDRYMRLPLYVMYSRAYERSLENRNREDKFYLNRKFCAYVISNALSDDARRNLIDKIGKYKQVDSGGKYNNNVGGCVRDKIAFISQYKFNICCENTSVSGYTTEKILEGFAGAGIPIYWGNPVIAKEFNPNAFINCHDYVSYEKVVERIIELDTNNKKYLDMCREPILLPNSVAGKLLDGSQAETFFANIFTQPLQKAYRRNRVYVGQRYYKMMQELRIQMKCIRFHTRVSGYLRNRIKCKVKTR